MKLLKNFCWNYLGGLFFLILALYVIYTVDGFIQYLQTNVGGEHFHTFITAMIFYTIISVLVAIYDYLKSNRK